MPALVVDHGALRLGVDVDHVDLDDLDCLVLAIGPRSGAIVVAGDATLAPGANWKGFFTMLKARGRARGDFTCVVPGADGKPLASMDARFVAKRRA